MSSFLITFKPQSENPERGWPLTELQKVVSRVQRGENSTESWRFRNRKDAMQGDRVFLALQGRNGPAIIGYGRVRGDAEKIGGQWQRPIEFEQLVDPSQEVLADKADLVASVNAGAQIWRTQSSGVILPASIAADLERLVVGKSPKPFAPSTGTNPDWIRDELIIALDFYLTHRPNPPNKESKEIGELSLTLKRLGQTLYPPEQRADTFRNANGVYMKLMNFRRFDPQYTADGRTGLLQGSKSEEEVWSEFADDPARCHAVANAIIASMDDPDVRETWIEPDNSDDLEEAAEGRLLTRVHVARERNRKLVRSKHRQAMRKFGKLTCEACGFDFADRYGNRGDGFIECHHTKPVATLEDGATTHVDDLALVCANCHRMIHRRKPWLTVGELKIILHAATHRP